jgi:putative addiction module killer protein
MIEIRQYIDRLGRNPFERWVRALDGVTRARVDETIDKVEQGNLTMMKGVGQGVFELRLQFGAGYRIYCGRDGDTLVILLGGGTKRRQEDDIAGAQFLWQEYKDRKKELSER